MAQIVRPTPDQIGLLRDLIGFVRDADLVAQHVRNLGEAQDAHDAAKAHASELAQHASEQLDIADVKAAHAEERHVEADKREAKLEQRAKKIEADAAMLKRAQAMFDGERDAFRLRVQGIEEAHGTLTAEIAAKHAEATELATKAADAHRDGERFRDEMLALREKAAAEWARVQAVLKAAMGGVEPTPQQNPNATPQPGPAL